ncbi:Taurine catabolism dioxygenase TauD, TfdA family [Azospirillum lipoferum]|nr:Taurine catabolism dioxygenase TauD, TfdA family [Azospirillum lipoferum]
MYGIRYDEMAWRSDVPEDVRSEIETGSGAVMLTGMPLDDGNAALLLVAGQFGGVLTDGISFSSNPLEPGGVYRIEAKGDGVADDEGHLVYSTSPCFFPLHTDGYSASVAPDILVLLCVRPDRQGGGGSLLAALDDVLPRLSQEEKARLAEPVYPSLSGARRIVADGEIRFNPMEVARCRRLGFTPPPEENLAAHARLNELFNSDGILKQVHLTDGDCLIINNRRVVHGRHEYSPRGSRLLKRLWIQAPERGRPPCA